MMKSYILSHIFVLLLLLEENNSRSFNTTLLEDDNPSVDGETGLEYGTEIVNNALPSSPQEKNLAMLQTMDAMQEMMTGERKYNRTYYQKLRRCMDTIDPLLAPSQDAAWKGVVDYFLMNGTASDRWGANDLIYMEKNISRTSQFNMTVYEPCNYASNMAFFHVATELCDRLEHGKPFHVRKEYIHGLGKAFSFLAMGSAFMHGSHTKLGSQQDTRAMRVMAYLIHQAGLEVLPEYNPILNDLKTEPRPLTSLQLVEEFQKMFLTMPVEQWYNHTEYLDPPDYYLSITCIITTMLSMAVDVRTADTLIPSLMDLFAIESNVRDFVTKEYLPEIRKAVAHIQPGFFEGLAFAGNTINVAMKFIYAFLWQEEVMTSNPIFRTNFVNSWGSGFLTSLNRNAQYLNNFDYFNQDLQDGRNIYPGDTWCNDAIPHAKWHLQSAVGSLDLVYLADEFFRITSKNL